MEQPEPRPGEDPETAPPQQGGDRGSGQRPLSPAFGPQSPEGAARLAAMLREHLATVWRTVCRLGMPPLRADELTQETFITAARKLDHIEPGCERRFLVSVATRLVANERRIRAGQVEVAQEWLTSEQPDPSPLSDEIVGLKQLRCLLDEAVREMPMELGTVFVLSELEGLTGPEIAVSAQGGRGVRSSGQTVADRRRSWPGPRARAVRESDRPETMPRLRTESRDWQVQLAPPVNAVLRPSTPKRDCVLQEHSARVAS
jgi:DNA-directed RNA polymerase specialized sigma24 family protein